MSISNSGNSSNSSTSSREFLSSLLHNRILMFNTAVIASVVIFLAVANMQQETDLEEYATIPYDHTPVLREQNERDDIELVYDRDTFQVEYRVFRYTLTDTLTSIAATEESKPLPMSPATTVFYLYNDTVTTAADRAWMIAVAVKKVTDEPAVYMLRINDRTVAYFSDPFPTGHNSIVIYSLDTISSVKIEISKVRTLS